MIFPRRSAIVALLALGGCKPPKRKGAEIPEAPAVSQDSKVAQVPQAPVLEFPFRRTVTDQEGRKLDATVVGRSASEIYVVRDSDGMKARIGIATLSEEDQAFLSDLPTHPAPAGFFDREPERKPGAEQPGGSEAYIAARQREIDRLSQRNRGLETKAAISRNQIEVRSSNSEIERNNKEISRLQENIDRVRFQDARRSVPASSAK